MSEAVKRAQKREEILAATWRLIAEQGLRAANMRALAAAAGYANGALAYYFNSKDDLLRAAFEHVLGRTAARIRHATQGLTGLSALRAFCDEIIPHDEEKRLEARIVLPFWQEASQTPAFRDLHESAMRAWRIQIGRHLREASRSGEIRKLAQRETSVAVEQLLAILNGAQVLAILSDEVNTPTMLKAMVARYIAALPRDRTPSIAK